MRLFGRRDSVLILGLTVALLVVFARQISHLLAVAREVEQAYGLALIPGLIILTVVFFLHLQGKRQEIKAEAAASASAVREAQTRTHDLEQLVGFGQTLARSLDLDSIRDVLMQHLPQLAGTHEVWVMIRTDGLWNNLLINSTRVPRRELDMLRELAAAQAVAIELGSRWEREGLEAEGQVCFPMMAGGAAIGALGFAKTAPLADSQRGHPGSRLGFARCIDQERAAGPRRA